MALSNDLDTSSESEYDSDLDSTTSEMDENHENVEPERDADWDPSTQLYTTQLHTEQLNQLHSRIKSRAETPIPTFPKLPRHWPFRNFDIHILPDYIESPLHYFELFWGLEIWDLLVQNTNAYAQFKETRHKENNESKVRWWKSITIYEIRVFIALLIYIGICGTTNIKSFWEKDITTHEPMKFMIFYRFQQIKRYIHVSLPTTTPLPSWHLKLEPLASILRSKFQAYVVLSQNVSFDEMMVPFSGRSLHTLKIPHKPIKEGFKLWALYDKGYLWDFMFYSRKNGNIPSYINLPLNL
jgi:hypothetical protein